MIIRRRVNGTFTTIGNAAINDERLSYEALGVLCYLRSKPHDWEVRLSHLMNFRKIGRDKMRRIISELLDCGYMLRKKIRDATTGAFVGDEYLVFDEPQAVDDPDVESVEKPAEPAPENPALGQPAPGYPAPENPSLAYKEDSPKTESQQTTDSTNGEREARAKEAEPDPESDEAFQALLGKAVAAAGVQNVGRCWPLWRRLDDDAARHAALAGWDPMLADLRAKGRRHAPGLETYLRNRLWTQTEPAADAAAPKTMLELKTGEWFAFFWAAWRRGDLSTCRSMLRFAAMGTGYGCAVADLPTAEDWAALPKIERGGDPWRAWQRRLERDGLRLTDATAGLWAWAPSEWPEGESMSVEDEIFEEGAA